MGRRAGKPHVGVRRRRLARQRGRWSVANAPALHAILNSAPLFNCCAAMDTDKIKIYGARVRVDSMAKVRTVDGCVLCCSVLCWLRPLLGPDAVVLQGALQAAVGCGWLQTARRARCPLDLVAGIAAIESRDRQRHKPVPPSFWPCWLQKHPEPMCATVADIEAAEDEDRERHACFLFWPC